MRTADGRLLNRRVGRIRVQGTTDGLTRAQAERYFRRLQEEEELNPRPEPGAPTPTNLARELELWSRRSDYRGDTDLVFAHPRSGLPLDRSKLGTMPPMWSSMYVEHLDTRELQPLMEHPPPGVRSFFMGDQLGGSG